MSFSIVDNSITTKDNFRFNLSKSFSYTLDIEQLLTSKKHIDQRFHTSTPKSADAELNIAPRLAVARQIINASGQLER